MLAKKYPDLKKPINCVRRMGLLESIRDYQFHRNLAKIDEICLKEQWKLDGIEEGKSIGIKLGKVEGKAEGKAESKAEIIALLEKGVSLEEIKKMN